MKKSLGPNMLVYPAPIWVVGTYDADDKPNAMLAACGGACCMQPPCISVALRPATYSHEAIVARRAFTVSVPSEKFVAQADYLGRASGRKEDKFTVAGLTPVRSELVDAPYVGEFPLVMECRLVHTAELGMHTLFVGEIVDVKAEESVLNESGSPDMTEIAPLVYDIGTRKYLGIGDVVGRRGDASAKIV